MSELHTGAIICCLQLTHHSDVEMFHSLQDALNQRLYTMHRSLKHAVEPAVGHQFTWYHLTKHSYYEGTAGDQTGAY